MAVQAVNRCQKELQLCIDMPIQIGFHTIFTVALANCITRSKGLSQERARGPNYGTLIDELIDALRERYGSSLLVHWEDFSARNSYRLLARARERVRCADSSLHCGYP